MNGPAPFYALQNDQAAQADPVAYDQQPTVALDTSAGTPAPDAGGAPPYDASRFSLLTGTDLGSVPPPSAWTSNTGGAPGPMPTLADAAEAPSSDEEDPTSTLERFKAAALAKLQPAMKPVYPDPSQQPWTAGRVLGAITSLGFSEAVRADYVRQHNAAAEKFNTALQERAGTQALELYRADMQRRLADRNFALRQAEFQFNTLRTAAAEGDRQMRSTLDELRLRAYGTLDHPPKPEEQAAAGDQGMTYVPAPGVPGHFMAIPSAYAPSSTSGTPASSSTGYEPPAAGSPIASALDPRRPSGAGATPPPATLGTGAPTTTGTGSTGPLTSATLAQRKAADAAAAKKAAANADLTPRLDRIYTEADALKQAAAKVLPHMADNAIGTAIKGQVGGRLSLFQAAKSKDPDQRAAAAAMRNSARMIFAMIFGEAGGTKGIRITFPEIETFKEPLKGIITGATTVEEAQSQLDDIVRYLKENDPRTSNAPAAASPSAPATTTSMPAMQPAAASRESFNALLARYGH